MESVANIEIITEDKTRLRAMHYFVNKPRARIVVASATGVPQKFYSHFAKAANLQNIDVLTFDYRGIGQSAPASLKNYVVDYLDWSQQDLYAALKWANYDNAPVFIVGHSYGGHAVGLLPEHSLHQGAYVFGTGAGWSGWMPLLERAKVNLMWHVLAPIIVKRYGYLAWSKLGMGEDLPKGVYEQWKHWCQFPHYFFDDPAMRHINERFAGYKGDLIAVNATDDKWAQPLSRDAFVKGYANANIRTSNAVPRHYGMSKIDHMGYFRKQAHLLWLPIFDWMKGKI